jgi:hypothetical protein
MRLATYDATLVHHEIALDKTAGCVVGSSMHDLRLGTNSHLVF